MTPRTVAHSDGHRDGATIAAPNTKQEKDRKPTWWKLQLFLVLLAIDAISSAILMGPFMPRWVIVIQLERECADSPSTSRLQIEGSREGLE